MINEKEIESVSLSATKKDFYQIWNELLETAGKLSERWSPESTNESDPGIVLLKVLTAIADKLNYTIDKNTLECFMPSAAQEESMRKLCDMMGYNMKYYQSATTDVVVSYTGENRIDSDETLASEGIILPAYTNIKNADSDVNYFTLEQVIFNDDSNKTMTIPSMEGEVVLCADDTDNIVSMTQLSNNRYYLPEAQIAENGIFITNIDDGIEGSSLWTKVDNLNTQLVGTHCFKFCYDSKLQMPYLQFPEDISTIIEDGLVIRYTRTNGANGNISYNTLSKLEAPSLWSSDYYSEASTDILSVDNFSVKNASAATNGKNKESLDDAYNAYKKTIGTFDTLVTCRDYMNKIYQLTKSETDTTPLVSNIIVSDIRDDINRSYTLCTFNNYGIAYTNLPVSDGSITNFDLMLYPFTTISGNINKSSYEASFKYSTVNKLQIENQLEDYKTISHKFNYPSDKSEDDELVCIKNYLRLKAKITTTTKVTTIEEQLIKNNIYAAIYENFNARKIDFGEEIPFDTILSVIQNADTKIKNVSLDEPILYTKYCYASGEESDEAADYNKVALKNILSGHIELFDYNSDFSYLYSENAYPVGDYDSIYGPKYSASEKMTHYIGEVETDFNVKSGNETVRLNENEIIQFRAPNFKTLVTYPAYVNYFLKLIDTNSTDKNIAATFGTLKDYMSGSSIFDGRDPEHKNKVHWLDFVNNEEITVSLKKIDFKGDATVFANYQEKYGMIFKKDTATTQYIEQTVVEEAGTTSYYFEINAATYGSLYTFICTQNANYIITGTTETAKLKGIFKSLGSLMTRIPGYMIDSNRIKYAQCDSALSTSTPLLDYYIQITYEETTEERTQDGLGKTIEEEGIKTDSEYILKQNEFLLINYTPSVTDEDGNTQQSDPVNMVYSAGTIIRPNFNLIDSLKYKQAGHTPSKKSGYNFEQSYMQEISDVGGMFTLGTNEQIEIRDVVEIVLDDSVVYLYWERNDEDLLDQTTSYDDEKIIYFSWDEDPQTVGGNDYTAYTLKEGEYIYYTDSAQIDLAYYGNGTKIIKGTNTPRIYKRKINSANLATNIANDGLLAALPWVPFNLSSDNAELKLREYQYINLTTGDLCNYITAENETSISEIGISRDLDKIWSNSNAKENPWKVGSAGYTLADSETMTTLPLISSDYAWEVRSILNIDASPVSFQTLHNSLYQDGTTLKTQNKITLNYYDAATDIFYEAKEITPQLSTTASNKYVDLSFETNYICQSSAGSLDVRQYDYTSDGVEYAKNDFKVKLFENITVKGTQDTINDEVIIPMNNYGDGSWTKINLREYKKIPLNIVLPTIKVGTESKIIGHGVIMLYYNTPVDTEINKHAYLTISDETSKTITICNAKNGSEELFDKDNLWWKDGIESTTESTKYYLRSGINIVEISNSCILTINQEDDYTELVRGTITFSNLDIVSYGDDNYGTYTLKINSAIDYQQTNVNISPTAQLFEDIAGIDTSYNFYYNSIVDSSLLIEINKDAGEKLSDPAMFYDYNNINNKFVISEIDADYLINGISLTNSSKR